MIKIKFWQEIFCIKILFCNHYYSPLNTFMRKGKDPEPVDPEPYLWLTDRMRIQEAQKHLNGSESGCESWSRTLISTILFDPISFSVVVGEEQDDEGAVHQDEPRDQRLGGPAARVSLLHLRSDCRVGDQNEGNYLSVLWIRDVFNPDPGSLIPDPIFFHPGSRNRIFQARIPDPIFAIPDPGSDFCHPGSRIRFLPSRIPDPIFAIPDPGSASKNLNILTQKLFLSSRKWWSGIRILIYPSRIPDPGVKKALDPGSATL